MRSGEACHEQGAEAFRSRCRRLQYGTISFVQELEVAPANELEKLASNLAHRRCPDFLQIPTGGAELIDDAQKIVGRARDRFCDCLKAWIFRMLPECRLGSDRE